LRALAESGGHVFAAGQLLGMTRSAIYRRIRFLGVRGSALGGTYAVAPDDPVAAGGGALSLEAYERACVQRALDLEDRDVIAASERLGVGKSTLHRRLRALGLRHGSGDSTGTGSVALVAAKGSAFIPAGRR